MCGLAGFIGKSKDPSLTYRLITSIFEKLEVRGRDAAGFWGSNITDQVIYHKEPVPSDVLIKRNIWKTIESFNPSILLTHARGASSGVGLPSWNKNNHPFVSCDKKLGLIHNGRIPNFEYWHLQKYYETDSHCDSEILLRILEAADNKITSDEIFDDFDNDFVTRMIGIKNIWSYLNYTHMAVAIGESLSDLEKRLWLFRNSHRDLWTIDLREVLGQIFFVSTPEIWHFASIDHVELENLDIKLTEIPPEEVWYLNSQTEIQKFEIIHEGYMPWIERQKAQIDKSKSTIQLISELDENERIHRASNLFTEELNSSIIIMKELESKHRLNILEQIDENAYKLAIEKLTNIISDLKDLKNII